MARSRGLRVVFCFGGGGARVVFGGGCYGFGWRRGDHSRGGAWLGQGF